MAKKERKKDVYVNLAMKGRQGDYSDLIDPLDYKILEHLPDEGEMFADLYPIGKSSKELCRDLKGLDPPLAGARVRLMAELGLVVKTKTPRSSVTSFQRTAKGKEIYGAWLQQQK